MCLIYVYQNCSTCRDALKWLQAKGIPHEVKPIRDSPPTTAELTTALHAHDGDLRKLFNTSGQDYRALGLKDQLPTMSEATAFALLSTHGNLVKRPFLIRGSTVLLGFKDEVWASALI
jgi:arsenate reductase (glutaredoxin)